MRDYRVVLRDYGYGVTVGTHKSEQKKKDSTGGTCTPHA